MQNLITGIQRDMGLTAIYNERKAGSLRDMQHCWKYDIENILEIRALLLLFTLNFEVYSTTPK